MCQNEAAEFYMTLALYDQPYIERANGAYDKATTDWERT